ncbi:MAG: 2-oxoglutarate dehydrogenase E1 component [Alphaproteobacteria bacterium]|nr:2-oxoglutarate dehydrogenase E1 component [Alphaproteobacteria bacterium]
MSLQQQSFLSSANADFVAELYARFRAAPESVDPSWASFFAGLQDDEKALLGELRGASWAPRPANKIVGNTLSDETPKPVAKNGKAAPESAAVAAAASSSSAQLRAATQDSLRALMLIRSYRVRGHLAAKLDPLGLMERASNAELDPAHYGFTAADLDRPIFIDGVLGFETASLRQIITRLQSVYCGTVGVEFMHIQSPEEKHWLQTRIEAGNLNSAYEKPKKLKILQRLMAGEGFEKFLQVKFTGVKRFGLEGGETMIPALEAMIERGAELGLREVVVGMAHRGRLNVLTNILGKPFTAMFAEFQGTSAYPDSVQGSGDVKYHLGTSTDREFAGKTVHLTMNANPSHLEWVNPVAVGRVRAKQQQYSGSHRTSDDARDQVAALLIHGDAAFAGQGIVPETLMLSELLGYRTGGTLHFVINNQVGFTTSPQYARSGVYCTDVAKMIQAPIFHVNGDDVETVVRCAVLAMEYRQQFHRDVVIDMVCYRRHGHNESDEPAFTQPLMYAAIKQHPTVFDVYSQKLTAEGTFTAAEVGAVQQEFMARMERDFQAATHYKPNKADWLEGKWQGLEASRNSEEAQVQTGVEPALLREVGHAISKVPADFAINPKIAKQLEAKRAMIDGGEGLDWATAEALAFGTLLVEGTPVRLSGQDVGRGTFSQRHAVLYDQNNETRYRPLSNLRQEQAVFEAHDSPLSEAAVLGFDYGFSLAEPHALVCWEGQFGDFVNGAQIIIDQFIASSESKWLRMSGITLLLPHGHEGQGPEHSSCRLERFLQLCAEENWQVANCSTPANYFHILRRQIRRNFRKPLILATPKSLLRHKMCISKLSEFGPNTSFQRVIAETASNLVPGARVKRVVLCSGKIYYDLAAAREVQKIDDVAIVRLEQFYPFPHKLLAQELARYPNADIIWCQEEPENQGGWFFVDRRIEAVLTDLGGKFKRPVFVGRAPGAAPATGSLKRHNKEQEVILNQALGSAATAALAANG